MKRLVTLMIESVRDLTPIFIVIAFFQFVILQQPVQDLAELIPGIIMVILGLTLFIQGLEIDLDGVDLQLLSELFLQLTPRYELHVQPFDRLR